MGDPHDPSTVVGPLVAERQRDRVEGYLALADEAGARVAAGGGRPAHLDKGWYVAPTILADVDNSMRVAREEIFGPVLCLIPYDDEDDAVRIANDSPYGLAGGVWTGDPARGCGWPGACAPGASRSTAPTRRSRWYRSAASRSQAWAANSARRACRASSSPAASGFPRCWRHYSISL